MYQNMTKKKTKIGPEGGDHAFDVMLFQSMENEINFRRTISLRTRQFCAREHVRCINKLFGSWIKNGFQSLVCRSGKVQQVSRSSQGEKYNETYQSSRLDKCLRFKDPGGPLSVEKQAGLLAARAFQGDSDTLRGRCSLLIDTQENYG